MHPRSALTINNVTVSYGKRIVFKNANLNLEVGQSLAVVGESGIGKSSLLNSILGLIQPKQGDISVAGSQMSGTLSEKRSAIRRKNIGTVFQNGELLPQLTASENVALPLLINKVSGKEATRISNDLLDSLKVSSRNIASNRLSGGERQRVALARALVTKPKLILGDEPTGNLDGATRDLVADLLFDVVHQQETALLVVTHDMEIAARADRTALLTAEGFQWLS